VLTGDNILLIGDNIVLICDNIWLIGDNILLIGDNISLIGDNIVLTGDNIMLIGDNGVSGDRILVRVRSSTPDQTGPGAHKTSCITGTGSFPGVESDRSVTLTPYPL
jgi:hypothetical protein